MADLRRAVIQRLQALQCAGVEELSHTLAESLLGALQEQETAAVSLSSGIQKDPAPDPNRDFQRTVSSAAGTSAAEHTPAGVGQPLPWEKRTVSASGTVLPTAHSSYSPSSSIPASRPGPVSRETSVRPQISGRSGAAAPSSGFPHTSGTRRAPAMAPKRLPLSLDIIVPPHEDYSALAEMEDRHEALRLLGEKVARCTRCIDLVGNRTQTVLGTGNPYAELMFLGEAPGADEDRAGIPFVGRAGQLLTKMIENGMQIDRQEKTYICNILRCRPPGNRAPMPEEAFKCRQFLDTQIDIVKPKFICCLGASAAQYLLDTTTTISRMRLREFRYRNATVVCTYHPAYLLRNPSQKNATWQDLQFLMKLMGLPLPPPKESSAGA
ncbi:MAG: uracil-DNA glycosylase [Thermoguttaceae bacterium]|nr:uracil-DNA glycosylase [Thermoguttaceae bacterium]